MAQFDVYRNPRAGGYPFVVDVQSDVFAKIESCVVVPLAPRSPYGGPLITRARPMVEINGDQYTLVVPLLAAVARSLLRKPVGSLLGQRADVIAALDLLFTGT